ncbi:hypothetical protein BTZ20_5120 [Rhodococcus sp. MTM3W5.2]|nr:hypothetical protein BTZ20_5120 [Rhodococcus sp. MTM3W5.2]
MSDLTLSFYEPVGEGPVHAYLGYRADVLEPAVASALADRLLAVLGAACADADRRIGVIG